LEKQWYAVYTHTGQENKVKANIERMAESADLTDKVTRVVVPVEEEVRFVEGKRRTVRKKVFPGYVFVEMNMDDRTWYLLRNTSGVTGFVGSEGQRQPTPLPRDEVESILKAIGEDTLRARPVWEVGEVVRVLTGPFAELTGKIEKTDAARGKLVVLISIFGRDTPVELDFSQVGKI
jgi:transcriptional antiterminator NusG